MSSELRIRTIVGLGLIAMAVGALVFGGFVFWMLLSIAGVLMMGEWGMLTGASSDQRKMAMYAVSVPLEIL